MCSKFYFTQFVLIFIFNLVTFISAEENEEIKWIENFISEINEGPNLTESKEEESRRILNKHVVVSRTSTTTKKVTKPTPNLRAKEEMSQRGESIEGESRRIQDKLYKDVSRTSTSTKKVPKATPNLRAKQKASQRGSTKSLMDLKENTETTKKTITMLDDLMPFALKDTLDSLTSEFKGVNTTIKVVGKTAEFRDIILMTMSRPDDDEPSDRKFRVEDKFVDEKPEKKVIFIVHGLSTIKGVQYLFKTELFKKLFKIYTEHLDKFNIFLMPMANPDGAFYQQNKNNAPHGACSGVALDRNFDIAWSSHKEMSSCNQFYPGLRPFSEPETRAVRDILHRFNHKIVAFIHVHSNALVSDTYKRDAILYPKGFTESTSDDDRYIDLKGEVEEAMRAANFQSLAVEVQTLYEWYGLTYGTSVDYAASIFGIPFSLEFAMHPLDSHHRHLGEAHLEFVWGKVIDVVFNYIHKSTKNGGEMK